VNPSQLLVPAAIVLLFAIAATPAQADAPSHPCAATVDPEARLDCYDRAFPPVASAVDLDASRREQAQRDFGLSAVQKRELAPAEQREATQDRIDARVSSVSVRANGQRVVTLDNEQIWLITEVTDKGYLKPGDEVVVRRGAIGNFLLRTPGRVTLRVRRVL